ncbi:MAG: NAD(P)H-dependent oxidoreductase subunit E [candidate division KSB1 bacterium]|nr:NAD(P)H-dependent oxidoreductase subunit E [candidate division KSB1 bacterium]MDZ7340872.1 NAD(P)H-dependent oxidoreductase subunit E [candidate division KSB1 bacterium]
MDTAKLDEIIQECGVHRSNVIPILQGIQAYYNYLPEEALQYLSKKLNVSLIDLYSIASFYKAFSLTPRGKHLISVCLGTACHVRGGLPILEEVERRLDIKAGDNTKDNLFSLRTVNCLGACALGPIVVVDEDYHGNTTIQKVNEILGKYGYVAPAPREPGTK